MTVAVVAPAGTVTVELAATASNGFELDSVTTAPPVGAGDASVMVATLSISLTTVLGLSAKLERPDELAGFIVKVADFDVPLYEPVIVTLIGVEPLLYVRTFTVALVDPAGIVTDEFAATA